MRRLVQKLISFTDFEYEPPDAHFQQRFWEKCPQSPFTDTPPHSQTSAGSSTGNSKYDAYVYDTLSDLLDELINNNEIQIINYTKDDKLKFYHQAPHQWWRWDNWKVKLKAHLQKCGAIWFYKVSPEYTTHYGPGLDTEWLTYSKMKMNRYLLYLLFGKPRDNELPAIGKFELSAPIYLLDLRSYGKEEFAKELDSRCRLKGYSGKLIYLDDDPEFFRSLNTRCDGCIQFESSDARRLNFEQYEYVQSQFPKEDFQCRVNQDTARPQYYCTPVEVCLTYGGVDSIAHSAETLGSQT